MLKYCPLLACRLKCRCRLSPSGGWGSPENSMQAQTLEHRFPSYQQYQDQHPQQDQHPPRPPTVYKPRLSASQWKCPLSCYYLTFYRSYEGIAQWFGFFLLKHVTSYRDREIETNLLKDWCLRQTSAADRRVLVSKMGQDLHTCRYTCYSNMCPLQDKHDFWLYLDAK